MIKEGCENEFELLILLIFYLKNSQTSNLLLDDKNLKWGKYHYEINVFLKYTLDTIIDTYYEHEIIQPWLHVSQKYK